MESANFPPPQIDSYAPNASLAKCLVLRFDLNRTIIYCRDEQYSAGQAWESSDELILKDRIQNQQSLEDLNVHLFTIQELMSTLDVVMDQIQTSLHKGRLI